ncbi:AAA family ATPase [Methylocapsa polymorpha]|uniref:AAA family ATPase n=1 Tax=Methylocapsa polymorpha TaxID=3080828 RepID=A0ABZ0HTH8_9HYPH|nr:AAA family ATPase [Methylocapsa sp. RX1]
MNGPLDQAYLDSLADFGEPIEPERQAWRNGDSHNARSQRKMEVEWFDAAATSAMVETPDPLIDGLLDAGAMSVIYGDSNSGKTFVALDMGFHVSVGKLWNGRTVKRGLVVYVAAEGGTRIRKRLAALKKHYAGSSIAPLFALVRFPIDLRSNDADFKQLVALTRAAETETAANCVWIIVDTLSRAMAGGDENSPVDMGRVVAAADTIRDQTCAHLSYVHHTGKDAARGARGHSLLRAATDTEIEVTPGSVATTKQRDMESDFSIGFALHDIQIGEAPDGTPIKSAVVKWTGETAKPGKQAAEKAPPRSQRLLMSVIREALNEAGQNIRPIHDGPIVRAVSADLVRNRLYMKIAEKAEPDEDPVKLANRRQKAFVRAVEAEIKAKALLAAIYNGDRVLWLP